MGLANTPQNCIPCRFCRSSSRRFPSGRSSQCALLEETQTRARQQDPPCDIHRDGWLRATMSVHTLSLRKHSVFSSFARVKRVCVCVCPGLTLSLSPPAGGVLAGVTRLPWAPLHHPWGQVLRFMGHLELQEHRDPHSRLSPALTQQGPSFINKIMRVVTAYCAACVPRDTAFRTIKPGLSYLSYSSNRQSTSRIAYNHVSFWSKQTADTRRLLKREDRPTGEGEE